MSTLNQKQNSYCENFMIKLFEKDNDKYRQFVDMFFLYKSKSREVLDPLLKLKNLIKLVQDDEEIIESLNKLLPKEYIVPEKKS